MAQQTGIFVCPSCRAAVKSAPTEEGVVVCPECQHRFGSGSPDEAARKVASVPSGRSGGRSASVVRNLTAKKAPPVKPVAVIEPPVREAKTLEQARAEGHNESGDEEIIMPDGSRRVRRRKRKKKDEKNKGLIFFLIAWFSIIVIIFALFKVGGGEDAADKTDEEAPAKELAARNREVMRRLMPTIGANFAKFLRFPSLNGREQFIDRSAELSSAFNRFYQSEVFPEPESSLRRIDENVLTFTSDDIAIETIWEDEEGHRWGAVHVFDKVESWKLDWECFAPYSTETWARFRANLGAREGVFRLLARKRRVSNEKDNFSLSFYRAPHVFEVNNEYKNTQSPEVEVETESEVGQKFLKRWEDYQEGKSPYGSILAKNLDPRNHLRVTVRLAWEKTDRGEDQLVLKEILGVGWFGERIQNLHEEVVKKVSEEATDQLNEETSEES